MVTVTVGNVCATVDGLVNTVIAQLTLAPAFLRTGHCAVEEANASVGCVLAHIQGLQAKPVKNALCVVTLAALDGNVPALDGNVLGLCLWYLLVSLSYFLYCLSNVLTATTINRIYRPEPKNFFPLREG